ncbi:hypothetical protein FYK55_09610 [Roseiconus nitratireducens]|uniref:Type II secretory pathway component PulF n=1 Tax=Roseiconus nitratireducens TaxID=2605748 RepID=A0A5M6DH41_9BACT|nr:hypothetical protein [Roseiconus nitratireducens]KAA5544565.1 hypothetical protein FYK55_09610 [Roseiconus nitratireducens]
MPESSAERLISLNRQTIAMLRLGIPLELGLGDSPIERLREINETLALNSGREPEVAPILQSENVSPQYQAIAQALLAAPDPTPIFESIARPTDDAAAVSTPVRLALVEPLVVLGLGYLGMLLLCFHVVPSMEMQYLQQYETPTGVTRWLIAIRDWMPVWAVLFPLIYLALILLGGKWLRKLYARWGPGTQSRLRWRRREAQAERLSALVDSGIDRETAIDLARGSSADSDPIGPVAENIVRNRSPERASGALDRLARFYRFLAENRWPSLVRNVPAAIGLFVASLVVLAYGLALFVPWIEILFNLSDRTGV